MLARAGLHHQVQVSLGQQGALVRQAGQATSSFGTRRYGTMRSLCSDPIGRLRKIPVWSYWDGAFSDEELDAIAGICEKLELNDAGVTVNEKDVKVDETIRSTKTGFLQPTEETAWIFKRLFGVAADINSRFYEYDLNGCGFLQFARYVNVGDGYCWHVDGGIGDTAIVQSDIQPRKLSMVLALTDPKRYEGCELQVRIGPKPATIPMPRGRIAIFPSFVLHRVAPLELGVRETLTAWIVGPNFR